MAIKRGSKVDKSFSSASMTDLIFLLLMFMLISTTLINPNAIRLTLPRSSTRTTEKAVTTVSVTRDLQYYVEREPVRFDQLEGALRARLGSMQDPTISLHYDRGVPIDEFVKIYNITRNNNYKIILATEPE